MSWRRSGAVEYEEGSVVGAEEGVEDVAGENGMWGRGAQGGREEGEGCAVGGGVARFVKDIVGGIEEGGG